MVNWRVVELVLLMVILLVMTVQKLVIPLVIPSEMYSGLDSDSPMVIQWGLCLVIL